MTRMRDIAPLADRIPPGGTNDPDEILSLFLDWVSAGGLTLYPAQEEALLEIMAGKHVILGTPTGSGKSLVALGLHFKAACEGKVSFYTSPIKALASEKFFSLCGELGPENVGMLTGDASINREASVLCCTAEVLSNMALRRGRGLVAPYVVMDEFHYYADKERGVAWQVPLLVLPKTQFLLMSATLGDTRAIAERLHHDTGREEEPDLRREFHAEGVRGARAVAHEREDRDPRGTGGDPEGRERDPPLDALRQGVPPVPLVRDRGPPRRAPPEVPPPRGAARAERASPRHLRDRHARRRREHPDPDGPLHEAREVRRDEGGAPLGARVQADLGAGGTPRIRRPGERRRAGARAHRREAAGGEEVRRLGEEDLAHVQGPAQRRGVVDGRDVPEADREAAGNADVAVPADPRDGAVPPPARRGRGVGPQLHVIARPHRALPRGRGHQAPAREAGGGPRALSLPGGDHRPRSRAALPGRRGRGPPVGLLAPPGALALRAVGARGARSRVADVCRGRPHGRGVDPGRPGRDPSKAGGPGEGQAHRQAQGGRRPLRRAHGAPRRGDAPQAARGLPVRRFQRVPRRAPMDGGLGRQPEVDRARDVRDVRRLFGLREELRPRTERGRPPPVSLTALQDARPDRPGGREDRRALGRARLLPLARRRDGREPPRGVGEVAPSRAAPRGKDAGRAARGASGSLVAHGASVEPAGLRGACARGGAASRPGAREEGLGRGGRACVSGKRQPVGRRALRGRDGAVLRRIRRSGFRGRGAAPPPDEPEGRGPAPVGGHADSRRPEGRSHVGDLRGHRPPGRERARRPDPEDPADRNLTSPDYDARRRVREALAAFGVRALGSTQPWRRSRRPEAAY